MVPRCSDKIARVSSYSLSLTGLCFRVRGYHPLWPDFPDRSTNTHPITTTGLVPVRSPLLRESRLISFPPVTEMFQFTGFAPDTYGFSAGYPGKPGWVSPFRDRRVKAYLPARRRLSQATTSFIAFYRQGIRHMRLLA
jgi:hypothetical protein